MEPEHPAEPTNWGTWVIQQVIHPTAVFLPPAVLLLLMTYLVLAAFDDGLRTGIRSLAGVLFPLSLVTFVYLFQREWLAWLGRFPAIGGFLVTLVAGLVVMAVIRLAGRPGVPFTELVLSANFSLLAFSHATVRGNRVSAHSYGMISGMLLYIIFFGFPVPR